jgi:hypothetical protein
MKKITFRADDNLIEQARLVARSRKTTLSAAFREWLQTYVRPVGDAHEFDLLMKRLRHVRPGRHFTRAEMNEQ